MRFRCWFTVGLAVLCFSIVTHALPINFFSESRMLPGGIVGDQGFFLWALERALHSDSWAAFVHICSWSERFCFDLRAVPEEFNNVFTVATIARWLHQDSFHAIFGWYYLGLLLNVIAATAFIGTVSGNWIMAGALGCAVGLHESTLWRIMGHFSLVGIWPMIFSLTFLWKTLDAVFSGGRGWISSLVAGCISLFLTVWTSFYYTIFGLVLFPTTAVCFFMTRLPRASEDRGASIGACPRTARRLLVCAVCALVTLALVMYPLRYLTLDLGVEKANYVRSEDDVRRYSALWNFYVRPSSLSAAFHWLWRLGIRVPPPDGRVYGDVHEFLGITFLVFLFWATCVVFHQWVMARRSSATLSSWTRAYGVFLAAFLMVVFFSTAPGGLLIHEMFQGIRCFGRMAPFAALFGAVLIGRSFRDTARPYLLALVFAVGFTLEQSHHALVDGQRLIGTAVFDPFVQKLSEECKTRRLHISPETGEYTNTPLLFPVFFLAERAGCRLSGIDGPGKYVNPAPVQIPTASLTLRWQPGGSTTVDLNNGAWLGLPE